MCIYACVLFCHVLPPPSEPPSSRTRILSKSRVRPTAPPWISRLSQTEYLFLFLCIRESLVVWAPRNEPISTAGGGGLVFHSWKLLRGPSSDPWKTRSYRQGVGSASPDFFVLVTDGDVSQQMLISLPVIPRGRQARPLAPETPLNTQNSFFSDSRSNRGRGGESSVHTEDEKY